MSFKLETLIVEIAGDATKLAQTYQQAEKMTQQFTKATQQAAATVQAAQAGPGGGPGGLGSEGEGVNLARVRQMANHFNALNKKRVDDEKDFERAANSLDKQRQKAYEKSLNDQDRLNQKQADKDYKTNALSWVRNVNNALKGQQKVRDEQDKADAQAKKDQEIGERAANNFLGRQNRKRILDEYNEQKKAEAQAKKDQEIGEKAANNFLGRLRKKEIEKQEKEWQEAVESARKLKDQQDKDWRKAVDKARKDQSKAQEAQAKDERKTNLWEVKERQRLKDQELKERQQKESKANKAQQQQNEMTFRERRKTELWSIKERERLRSEEQKRSAKAQADQERLERQRQHEQRREDRKADIPRQVRESALGIGLATGAIAAPMAAFFKQSIEDYAQFNHAMVESTAMLGLNEAQFKSMADKALELGTKGKFGPTELAKAYFFLASSGYNAEQTIKLLPAVSNFAAAGMLSLQEATTLAANAQSAFGLKVQDSQQNMKNMTRITDVMVKASMMSNSTTKEMAVGITGEAAATMKQYGKSVEETAAILAVYADQGIKGEAAGGHLARSIRFLGERALKDGAAFRRFGINVFDTNGEMRNMARIMYDIEQAMAGMSDESKAQIFRELGFEARLQKAVTPLIGMSSQLLKYQAALESAGGTTKEIADKQMESFINQMERMWNGIKAISITVGEQLAPALLIVADAVMVGVSAWMMIPNILKSIIVFAGAAGTAVLAFTSAIILAGVAFNVLFGGVGLIAGVIVTLITGYLTLVATYFGAAIGLAFALTGGFKSVRQSLKDLWEWLAPVRKAFASLGKTVLELIGTAFVSLKNTIFGVFSSITGSMTVDWTEIRNTAVIAIYAMEFGILNFGRVAELVWLNAQLKFFGFAADIMFFFDSQFPDILQFFARNWETMWGNAKATAYNFLLAFVKDIWSLSGTLVNNLVGLFSKLGEAIGQNFQDLISNMVKLAINLPDLLRGKTTIKDLWELPRNQLVKFEDPFVNQVRQEIKEQGPELQKMRERALTPREEELKKKIGDLNKELGDDFNDFLVKKLRENQVMEVEAEKKGKEIGADVTKGAYKEMEKFDSALTRSAEAITRYENYLDRIRDPQQFRNEFKDKPLKVEANVRDAAAGKTREDKTQDLLKRIAEASEEQLRREGIRVQLANLNK